MPCVFVAHGEDSELSGGLDVRLARLMKSGGDSRAVVVPFDATGSFL